MVSRTTLTTGAAALVTAGSLAFAGATLATADTTTPDTQGSTARTGERPGGGHEHTEVTGDEAAKVTAAVKAKDSSVSVSSVVKDPDGSYDVRATKSGAPVMVEVSKDLKTVEVRTGGPGQGGPGRGGPGGMHENLTAVTGSEATGVTKAVTAKDGGFTVQSVMKDDQGDYHVMGTKDGQPAMAHVSSDLKTVEVRTGHGPGGMRDGNGPQGAAPQGRTVPSTGTSPTDVPEAV